MINGKDTTCSIKSTNGKYMQFLPEGGLKQTANTSNDTKVNLVRLPDSWFQIQSVTMTHVSALDDFATIKQFEDNDDWKKWRIICLHNSTQVIFISWHGTFLKALGSSGAYGFEQNEDLDPLEKFAIECNINSPFVC